MRIIENDKVTRELSKGISFDKEFFPLLERLVKNDVPFDVRRLYDGFQLFYPNIENQVCDVIIHSGSYGYQEGLLEIMGLIEDEGGDSVVGYLHEYEVFNAIFNHYINNKDS